MPGIVGAQEVPINPLADPLATRELLVWLRNAVMEIQQSLIPPNQVTNVRATAMEGAVLIEFTRSDGDQYVLYWNTRPSINMAVRVDLGESNRYVDQMGAGTITRWYAIKAKKGRIEGDVSTWVSATSLALGTVIVPPTPPASTQTPVTDQETGAIEIGYPTGGQYQEL